MMQWYCVGKTAKKNNGEHFSLSVISWNNRMSVVYSDFRNESFSSCCNNNKENE